MSSSAAVPERATDRCADLLGTLDEITVIGSGAAAATATRILRALGATVRAVDAGRGSIDVRAFDDAPIVLCDVVDCGVPEHFAADVAERAAGLWITISAFGLDGPLGGRPGSDLVCAAASGLLSTVSGPPGRYHPMPGRQALKVAGETAALAVMHGVSELRAGEPALHLDLSVQEAAAFCSIQQEVSHHLYECGGPAGAARYATPSGLFSCTDGELGIVVLDDHQWVRVAGVLGRPELAEQYPSPAARLANRPVIDQVMREWTAGRSKLECERLLQEAGVAAVALRTPEEARALEQFRVRGFVTTGSTDDCPRTHVLPAAVTRRPAPQRWADRPGSLRDLRVAEVTGVLAGPLAGAILGAMGAEVVRLEDAERLDIYRRNGPFAGGVAGPERAAYFAMANYNKRSVSAGIGSDPGLVRRICGWADLLLENVGARRLGQLAIRPDEMFLDAGKARVAVSGFGHTGPCAAYKAYAPNVHAFGGFLEAVRISAGPEARVLTSFADYCASVWGALLAAAWWLGDPGEACDFDIAMAEVVAAKVDDVTPPRPVPPAEAGAVRGREFLVRCADGDVALATTAPTDVRTAAAELGLDVGALSIVRSADAFVLDVRDGTAPQSADVLAAAARFATACRALVPTEVITDEQLAAREFFLGLDHAEIGTATIFALPWKRALRPRTGYRAAPLLGQDDRWMAEELTHTADRRASARP
ncbi:Crotonobetainyl-CoA:carnitine CoA-transferase CaiB [Pseudonocardia thermophila]|uniref:Crotonobetainyl-CoA:carnitine CoA-transferase CaiB n=1 Tax=Pseudonocardia thermophila TaxID=1848 RepID=A0A1M6XQS7_PSETH|nr:CoA transferase [Pseudonocardia thermophila]SHL08199.1 Crotonobetainyl-CoA:carnitine CoA-transferase CaiB [Pseudonocardia thermophila]